MSQYVYNVSIEILVEIFVLGFRMNIFITSSNIVRRPFRCENTKGAVRMSEEVVMMTGQEKTVDTATELVFT